jgi:ribose transport system ATP-binding protein
VYQELSLANNLSVADNLFANHAPHTLGVIQGHALLALGRKHLAELNIPIDAEAIVGTLTLEQRQLVEIAKALNLPSRVVIMDEPTSALGLNGVSILFEIIQKLKSQNKAVVYISQRMEEVMQISDDISIMRDGQFLLTLQREDATAQDLLARMLGRNLQHLFPKRTLPYVRPAQPVLEVRDLHATGLFSGVHFALHAGEILGLFGLMGAGRSEVMKALFGIHKYRGDILIDSHVQKIHSPQVAIANGIAFVTENRQQQGVVPGQSIASNITMVRCPRRKQGRWLTDEGDENRVAQDLIGRLRIKCAHQRQNLDELSGGNQQKVVFAKWIATHPKILILDEPTKGIDVGAKYELYALIRELATSGTAVILVSSELPEALAMCDRLLVMRERKIVRAFDTRDLSPQTVMQAATGAVEA